MCYDDSAQPPACRAARTEARTESLVLKSVDGAKFGAFRAEPVDPAASSGVGVLLLPDNLGLRAFYDQLAVQLAEQGHTTLAIDYFGRSDGLNRDRPADFPVLPHLGKLRRNGLYADFAAGISALRRGGCRAVVSLGFCVGGRFAFLTADPAFGLAGAIGLYGAPGPIRNAPGPIQRAGELTAPILGMFGSADDGIPPQTVKEFDRALTDAGVEHEIVGYPGAPHGFFDQSLRDGYADECADVWRRMLGFLDSVAESGVLEVETA
ncbi:MAG TPA: dienelactone hydrolase family protein [Pseudonocardiaceae bacterium]|nr:dienelactone hydrolase family protein [Pseudonocardiaceae bacterium]